MSEWDALRSERPYVVLDEGSADLLAERMANRFHSIAQKLKGGSLTDGADGQPGSNSRVRNQWGGKGIIKYAPSSDEITAGISQQKSLLVWQSPDGLPHFVTIDVGRLANGYGAPASNGSIAPGLGGGGAGTFPNNGTLTTFLSYRATAQIVFGTPGAMQDPFYIDIGRGQRFSALVSYVAITAQAEPPPAGLFSGAVTYAAGSLAVYATLGIGFAPTLAPVIFSQYVDVVNAGTVAAVQAYTLPIPPRANFLLPVQSSNKSDTIRLIFLDAGGRAVSSTQDFATGAVTAPIALAEDYDAVILRNEGLVFANYRLIYQLSV